MTPEQLALLQRVDARLEGVVNQAALDKWGEDFEKRIMQKIPAAPAVALHGLPNEDRKRLVSQLTFIMSHDQRDSQRTDVQAEMRALGVSTGEAGGYLVPDEFIAELQRKLIKRSVIRPVARVFTGVGKKGTIPRETGTVTVVWEGENVATAETQNPKFGAISWNLNKLKALTKIPVELMSNAAIDVLDILSDMFAEQIEVEQDKVFMTGSGANRPTGLRTNTTGMTSIGQAGANLTFDDLVKIKHTLKSQYRAGAVWFIHNDIISLITRIKDLDGRPIFLDISNMGGQGTNQNLPPQTVGSLLGAPVLEQNDIPTNLGGGSNESEIWYGDMKSAYAIFDQGTMEMSSTTEGFGTFESDQMAVKALMFVDGKVKIPEAVCFGTGVK